MSDSRQRLSIPIVAVLLLVFLSRASAWADQPAELVLTGGIQHSERLDEVDDKLSAGRKFSESNLPKWDDSPGRWYSIPFWMAGKIWQANQRTRYFVEDLNTLQTDLQPETYVDQDSETLGWQVDGQGGIWQYDARPFIKVSQGQNTRTYHLNYKVEPLAISDRQFGQKVTSTQIKVDDRTNIIQWVLQVETIRTFSPVAEGQIRVDESSKIFDGDGAPSTLQKAYYFERRIEPFLAIDTYNGRDLRESFCSFLQKVGRPDLLP